jgi:flagellar biosynthesis anti-sigma factor FlgM
MKISEIFSVLFPKVRKAQSQKTVTLKKVDSKLLKRPDEVKLAEDAKFISTLRAEMKNKPDASREETIAEIKRRLDNGTYQVKADDLARKILGD